MSGSRKALAPALAMAVALLSSISSSPSLTSDDLYGPARGHLPLTDSRKKRSISLYYIGHHLRGEYNARRRTDGRRAAAAAGGTARRRTTDFPSLTNGLRESGHSAV